MNADFAKARRTAEQILNEYEIKTAPIDPELLAESRGLEVMYADFNDELRGKISGFIDLENNQIVVNKATAPTRMVFTIAHELGHFEMHRDWARSEKYRVLPRRDSYEGAKPPEEQEADAFASHLLVPRAVLRRYKDIASIPELARMFCVSEVVVLNALKRM